MLARTDDEIMVDALLQQSLMETRVHVEEEIAIAAIDDDSELPIPHLRDLIYHRIVLPVLRKTLLLTQLITHIPVFGERTDIHAPAGATHRREYIAMPDRVPQRAMATHAKPRDGTPFPIR